jgi:hypothetical protein
MQLAQRLTATKPKIIAEEQVSSRQKEVTCLAQARQQAARSGPAQ